MNAHVANQITAVRRIREPYCGHWERLATAIEQIFPRKTAWNLAAITGLKVRACFQFLARKSSLSSDALVCLLDTAHGPEILRALMGDSKERWWIEFKLMWDREQVARRLEEIERQIAETRGRK